MEIPNDLKDFINSVNIIALSTCDKNKNPNVVAIRFKKIVGSDTIWIVDTYFNKTKQNLIQNSRVAIAIWKGKQGYQIKGNSKYHSEGKIFDDASHWATTQGKKSPNKGVLEVKVTEIYSITPTYEEAGKRLA